MVDSDDPDRYEQIAEHARGGLGRVVRAIDKRLGRTVAVKEMLLRGSASSPAHEARFLREALITARLEHPGIVPVHEAGRWPNGDPYYVMKLVEGRTLKELIAEHASLRERLALLPHVIAIADAVGYAHSEGVIHRDLKPSNVIVGSFGETIVVDWGLARDRKRDVPEPSEEMLLAAGSGVATISGKVVGTPAYMSPEQARGDLVDERADVYALGAVLYELLAGVPPHNDVTPQATLERVIAGPPRPLAAAAPHVPDELATIVTKAMARSPEDRYANATALAEDLRRFQTGKLVSAHSYSTWSLVRKKLSQHRGVVAVAIASTLALGAIGVESFRRVVAERNIARSERSRAIDAQSQAEHRQRELVLLQAATSLREDPTATLAWLKDYRIGDDDRAQVLELVDEAVASGVARHVFRPGDWVLDAQFTPDGSTLVTAVRDGSLHAFDLRTGLGTKLGTAESGPELLAMSPDGRFAVTAGMNGEVTMWPLGGGAPRVLARDIGGVGTLELSPDGTRILVVPQVGAPHVVFLDGRDPERLGPDTRVRRAVAKRDWTIQFIAPDSNQVGLVTGDKWRPLARTEKAIQSGAVSPRGDVVIIHDGETLWRVSVAGGKLENIGTYGAKLKQFVWSPDERTLALAGDLHDVHLLDLATGAVTELRGHTDAIYTVEWTRDGRRLLSASDDGSARVWTVKDGTAQVLRGHADDVYRARFSQDERQVVTASLDGTARVWSLEQAGTRTLVGNGDEIERMSLKHDRVLLKTKTEVAWMNLATGHRVPVFSWAEDRQGVGVGRPSPDGEYLLMLGQNWSLVVRHRGGSSVTLHGHTGLVTITQWSHDQRALFTASVDGTLRRWDVSTGKGTVLVDGAAAIHGIAIRDDDRVIAQIDDAVYVIEPDGRRTTLGEGPAWTVNYGGLERIGDRYLLRRTDQSLALLDGERLTSLEGRGYPPMGTALSPDGSKLAGAMNDRTVRIWDVETGRLLETLRGHTDLPLAVAFSPDGMLVASSSYDKTIRVWQLGASRHRVLRGHAKPVDHVAWQDAAHVVSGSRDGTVRIWDVPPMTLPTAAELVQRINAATTARIDVDRPATGTTTPRGT